MTKFGGDQVGAVLQPAVDLRIVQADIFASGCIVGGIEAAADVAFVGPVSGIAAEAVMEVREVRQIGHVRHQALHPRIECIDGIGAALAQIAIDLAADLDQHADQMGDVAAGVVDVGLDQHGIARGLVDLDAVTVGQDALELRAVEAGGAAHQRQARRIETELVFLQAVQDLSPVDALRQVSR